MTGKSIFLLSRVLVRINECNSTHVIPYNYIIHPTKDTIGYYNSKGKELNCRIMFSLKAMLILSNKMTIVGQMNALYIKTSLIGMSY